jgi:predicted transcriptional regulator
VPAELYDFTVNTVGRALRRLQALGLIERLKMNRRVAGALGTWRWKAPVSTFVHLEQQITDESKELLRP